MAPVPFTTNEENDGVTRVTVAAVLSIGGDGAGDAFSQVAAILLEDESIIAWDDEVTATFLLSHSEALDIFYIITTPALIVNGVPVPYDREWVVQESRDGD